MPVNSQPSCQEEDSWADGSQADSANTCQLCNKSASAKSALVSCVTCGGHFHVGCLINRFVDVNGTALRIGYSWLAEFLHGNFHYTCSSCNEAKKATGGNTNPVFPHKQDEQPDVGQLRGEMKTLISLLTAMSNNIEQITQQMNELKDGILQLTAPE